MKKEGRVEKEERMKKGERMKKDQRRKKEERKNMVIMHSLNHALQKQRRRKM